MRLVKNKPAIDDDFLDSIDEYKNRPWQKPNECHEKSMSLFIYGSTHHLKLKSSPRIRSKYKFQAQINYQLSNGVFFKNNSGHVAWWQSQTDNPKNLILKIIGFDD